MISADIGCPVMERHCPICLSQGSKSLLHTYQVNLKEAIPMCPVKMCPYPLISGGSSAEFLKLRPFTHPDVLKQPKVGTKKPAKSTIRRYENSPKPQKMTDSAMLLQPLVQQHDSVTKSHLQNISQGGRVETQTHTKKNEISSKRNELPLENRNIIINSKIAKNISSQIKEISSKYNCDRSSPENMATTNLFQTKSNFYLQWKNKDALCWLDVSMLLLLHCASFCKLLQTFYVQQRDIPNTKLKIPSPKANLKCNGTGAPDMYLLCEMYKNYYNARDSVRQAIDFQRCAQSAREGRSTTLQMSIGRIIVKTGGGQSRVKDTGKLFDSLILNMHSSPKVHCDSVKSYASSQIIGQKSPVKSTGILKPYTVRQSPKKVHAGKNQKEWVMTSQELEERAESLLQKAKVNLEETRSNLWMSLKYVLNCELGKNDSPVFALPSLLKQNQAFEDHFTIQYYWQMDCTQCGYHHIDSQKRPLPSFPSVPKDFCMLVPYFIRPCFQCQAPSQRLTLIYQHIPDAIIAHFVDGLHEKNISSYDFIYQGSLYAVKGVVQYINNPDHFVAWIRDNKTNQWMECDGLKDEICGFCEEQPNFPPNQVHLVLWENVGSPAVNLPVNVCAQRLMAGCPAISPLPDHLIQKSVCAGGDTVIISSPEVKLPGDQLCYNVATPTPVETKGNTNTQTPYELSTMSSSVLDSANSRKVQHLGLAVLPGIKPIGNNVIQSSDVKSGSLGTLPADRSVKKLNEINSFIANSMQLTANSAAGRSKGENIHTELVSLDKTSTDKSIKNSQKSARLDRLQRMRDKLSKGLSKANASEKGTVHPADHSSNVHLLNTNHPYDKKTVQQVKAVRHLSTSALELKSPESNLASSDQIFTSVMRSPSQQKSSIQELLAKVRGSAASIKGAQTFDGYKPKKGFTTLKIDVKTRTTVKSSISPNKKNAGKRKTISFSNESKGNESRKVVKDSSKLPKKPKFLIGESETMVNGGEAAVKYQPAISIKGDIEKGLLEVNRSINHRGEKIPANINSTSNSHLMVNINDKSLVQYYASNKQVPFDLITTNCSHTLSEKMETSGVGSGTATLNHFDQTVPMSETKSQGCDIIPTNNTFSADSQSQQESEFPEYNCEALDDVMSELCATLDIPDRPVLPPENASGNHGSCNSSPIKKLLEENLPRDLNQSMEFDPTDFDTLLFNESL